MSKKETDIYLGGGSNINVRTASIVSVNNSLNNNKIPYYIKY